MPTDAERASRAIAGHRAAYGADPAAVAFAPGRVNLMGDHTDYNGGLALPIAIDAGTTCALSFVDEPNITVGSTAASGDPIRIRVDEAGGWRRRGWSSYVVGALVESGALDRLGCGAMVWIDGDVPVGAGLSSSASVECSVLMASSVAEGRTPDRWDTALAAQRAEHEFAGVPCGILDQATSMLALEGHALVLDSRALTAVPVPVPLAAWGLSILIVNTRVHHELADGGYADRRMTCERSARALGLRWLTDLPIADVALVDTLDEPDRRRSHHVISEHARVLATVEAFSSGDLAQVGTLFAASHSSLAHDFDVSCPELDLAVEATTGAGAIAARMTGGGFGGSVVALVASSDVRDVVDAVLEQFMARGFLRPEFLEARPSAGARALG